MKSFSLTTTTFSGLVAIVIMVSGVFVRADDQASPTPQSPNQMKMNQDNTEPKASIVGVKPNSAGAPNGHAGLDPSNGSSMGLGIQIPFGSSGNNGNGVKKGAGASKGAKDVNKESTESNGDQNGERDSE